MKKKVGLINSIRLSATLLFLLLAIFILGFKVHTRNREITVRADQMRAEYIQDQRQRIKYEVDRVAKVIDYEVDRHFRQAQEKAKQRVLEAYAIASNIYNRHEGSKTDSEIQQIIIDALRPVRFDDGNGYYFIQSLNGIPRMIADTPELENTNLLNFQDSRGNYLVRDMIEIVKSQNEGFYSYYWTKPNEKGNDHEKVSYLKLFEPFNWFLGTGVYLGAVETAMQDIIAHYVATHRFGTNGRGYVFINELLDINGGEKFARVYANPNRPGDTGKFISDDFKDAKGKMFRREFLQGLREKGECFVDYWYKKIGTTELSPKTSYFKLAGEGRFIVAAGVYIDDIEGEIQAMQAEIKNRLRTGLIAVSLFFIGVFLIFMFILDYLSRRTAKDFHNFSEFFKRAATSSQIIDRDTLKFKELDELADYANKMLDDKKAIERALDLERERLLVTLHSIIDGVISTDTDGYILLLNKVAEQLTGWKEEEVIGKHVDKVLRTHPPALVGSSGTADAAEEFDSRNVILISRLGQEYKITVDHAPVYSNRGALLGNVVVFRDETEKLKTEEELFKARKLESIGLLAGGIAHDFNNILSGIFGNIELAKTRLNSDEHAYKFIQMALDSLQRAKSLTTQLLTFAKGGEPLIELTSLQQMIDDVVTFNLSGSPVKPKFEIPEKLWFIKADRGQISQVITNIVINAKQAMAEGGDLLITAENIPAENSALPTDSVKLEIRDTGVGMSTDIQQRVFDPYFSTKPTGNGLGLSMAHSIIEKHNGLIEVSSRPGHGTTFTIYFPAKRGKQQDIASSSELPDKPESTLSLKILLIDDDLVVQEVLSEMLRFIGYSVDVAADGARGVTMYEIAFRAERPYQLVLSDLTIPGGMGGKEAVRKIVELDPDARVIAISGYATDPIMAKYEEYGFKGRIAKPFKLSEVQEEIQRICSSPL